MTVSVRPLVAGNWKMNGRRASASEVGDLISCLAARPDMPCDVMVCPPAPYLPMLDDARRGTALRVGAQDCSALEDGAHTGDISAAMLADVGCEAVIVGHSERRMDHGETDSLVRAKAEAAHGAGLTAIICIGETEAERDGGRTLDVLARQLSGSVPDDARAAGTVIAYEPVWAIGTGRTPTAEEVAEAHASMREALVARFGDEGRRMRLLYGGSVKPSNAAELMAIDNVDGALVGGASLKASDFWGIIQAYLD